MTEIKNEQFGVRIEPHFEDHPGHLITLLSEDDDNWFEVGNPFSCWWLDDLIDVLEKAKKMCSEKCYKLEGDDEPKT